LEKLGHQRLIPGQGSDIVPEISRREKTKFAAKTPAAPAVVGDSNYSRDIAGEFC
jgi:hypothetical protein